MEALNSQNRIKRISHELHRREVEVIKVTPLGENFVAVTFGGDSLQGFVSDSFDDHVKLCLTDENGKGFRRDYTPRHFDPVALELTLEFGLHGNGPGATWAKNAHLGQCAMIGGPRASLVIPTDYAWQLLVGDSTALPAIRRRLAELPSEAKVIVVVQALSEKDVSLESSADLAIQIVSNADALVASLSELKLPSGDGFCWGAGEAAMMSEVRRVLRDEKQVPKEAMRIAAYWRKGDSAHHENL